MPDVLCKACGEQHGELEDYDEGDTLECECGSEYEFRYSEDSRYPDTLKMFNVVNWETEPEPQDVKVVDKEEVPVEVNNEGEVLETRTAVTYEVEEGHRVREWEDQANVNVVEVAESDSGATEPGVTNE